MDYLQGLSDTEIKAVEAVGNKGTKSYAEVAKEVGISERQLYRIRQKPEFKTALHKRAMEEMSESVSEFTKMVERKAIKEGHYKFAELYAKMNGLLVDRSEVKQTTEIDDRRKFSEQSNEDLEKELKELGKLIDIHKDEA
ncbi:phBC6A51 family helix-turn-helix protein [Bacillus sp. SG-1]|uniref:phBC6A51 family helix-turn-helix protein n=1 Tax=Bacillus sp. SG-1 TaxID=161544 RepID=UPI0001543E89|nr:phBC6A51 family helix-turn-helix protein [Bacillus sp. SG-1]EDL65001.1 hypothetical protein BSG1_14809 [Bacillus sp. SG-1]